MEKVQKLARLPPWTVWGIMTHNCPINEQTADGRLVGRCWFALKDGKICPRHGDVYIEALYYDHTGKLTVENDMRRRKNLPVLGC
jgi:hypothetical protein